MTSPPALNGAPRRILPPPTTIASWTPRFTIRCACRAKFNVSSMLMPLLLLPWPNPSPLIFKTTRLYFGLSASMVKWSSTECPLLAVGNGHVGHYRGQGFVSQGSLRQLPPRKVKQYRTLDRL